MYVRKLSNEIDAASWISKLEVEGGGRKILSEKMELQLYYIQDLHVGAANILKQDALSVGADLAVPKSTVLCASPRVDCILMGTRKHMQILSRKELAQPFGLKSLAQELKKFLKQDKEVHSYQIMGVMNANDDSFYAGSRFSAKEAIVKIETMIEEGADIIDIGAVSSRPGAASVSAEDELTRLRPVIDALYKEKIYEKVQLSLDSYSASSVSYALERGFHIINDITGLADDEICRLIGSFKAKAVIMHMQGTPQTMQKDPQYSNLFKEMEAFFLERIAKAESFDIKDTVLDVGIGFGKSLEDNLVLIQHLGHFKKLHKQMLIGASRKSMIDKISPSSVEERLPGTLAIHLKAYDNGAEIIRTHDVKEHVQAFKVHQAIVTRL
jgi:dihydropteroate synthase